MVCVCVVCVCACSGVISVDHNITYFYNIPDYIIPVVDSSIFPGTSEYRRLRHIILFILDGNFGILEKIVIHANGVWDFLHTILYEFDLSYDIIFYVSHRYTVK